MHAVCKERALSDSEPRLNPERVVQAHHDHDQYAADFEVTPAVEDKDSIEHASQAHILKIMELMGCDEGSSVRQLPHIVKYNVQVRLIWLVSIELKMCFGEASRLGHSCCCLI